FYSKSNICHEKTIEQAERSLAKFGEDGVERFRSWASIFE
ncbi:MAG: phosphohydrolase, partial [Prevotellaceae bacterium]|nr:phosphohydrolase [Prevotellaceae bacterium]